MPPAFVHIYWLCDIKIKVLTSSTNLVENHSLKTKGCDAAIDWFIEKADQLKVSVCYLLQNARSNLSLSSYPSFILFSVTFFVLRDWQLEHWTDILYTQLT